MVKLNRLLKLEEVGLFFEVMKEARTFGRDIEAARMLMAVARHGARHVSFVDESTAKLIGNEPRSDNLVNWLLLAVARGEYQKLLDAGRNDTQVWISMLESSKRSERTKGLVALFESVLDAPDQYDAINTELEALRSSSEAHVRVAGSSGLELIKMAALIEAVHSKEMHFAKGLDGVQIFKAAGFPFEQLAWLSEQVLRYPGLRQIPSLQKAAN